MSEANVYSIINNPLLQDPAVIQAAVDNIQSTLATLTEYTPAEVNTFVDWSYDAGDIVTLVNDASDYVMPIFNNIVNWNGAGDVTWTNSGNEVRELPTVTQRQTYAHGTAIQAVETGLAGAETEFHTYMEQTDTYIQLIADETDVETAQTLNRSLYKITSEAITQLVTKVGAVPDGSNLYSLYQQEADKISLVVGTNQGTNYIKAAEIVTEINGQTGQGQVRIDAGQITLNGTTAIKGNVTIDGTTYVGLNVSAVEAQGVITGDLDVTHKFTMDSGTTCIFYNSPTFDEDVTMYNPSDESISVPAHLHKLSITEATSGGTPTGEITVTIGEMTNTSSEATKNFDMSDTDWYADRVSEFNQEIADAYTDGYTAGYADGYADGGGGSGNIVYRVPVGATVNSAFMPANYAYEWIAVEYQTGGTSYKGFMMAQYIRGTNAYSGSGTVNPGCEGGYTSIPSSMIFSISAQVTASSGSTVNLRSSPST